MQTPSWPCSLAWCGSCQTPTPWMAPRSTSSEVGCQGEPGSDRAESRSRPATQPATGQKDRSQALCGHRILPSRLLAPNIGLGLCPVIQRTDMAGGLAYPRLPSSLSSFLLLPSHIILSLLPNSPSPSHPNFPFQNTLLSNHYRTGVGFHHWGHSSGTGQIVPWGV